MRKVKRSFAKGLACVFLLFCVLSYNINISAAGLTFLAESKVQAHSVYLDASFSQGMDLAMESTDGVNYGTTVELSKGNYQFRVIDNDAEFGHPGTINDTTATVSTSGWKLSDTINAKSTLIATGGTYTFAYNTESHKLQVLKAGFATPDEAGESLKLNIGNVSFNANVGDKVSYDIYLKAENAFEDVQSILSYNEDKLELSKVTSENPEITDTEAEALKNCPNLEDVVYNSDYPGVVAANASNVEGYDFTEEKLFLSLDFKVVATGETNIEFTVQEMTELGGEKSYFLFSTQRAGGVNFRGEIVVEKAPEPTEPTEPAETTEATEATKPSESTAPAETEPVESTTSEVTESTETTEETPIATEPQETTAPASTDATEPTETQSTEPAETQGTEPAEPSAPSTSEVTEPAETESETATEADTEPTTETEATEPQFELGDVNRDEKLNIRDATLIQKFIAKIASLDDKQILLADYKPDGKVNIKDATLIQKKIANLI